MDILVKNEKEMMQLGAGFARQLQGGEIILLIGDLGSGKTTFVKGVAKKLGIKKTVTSPTFVLMKMYKVSCSGTQIKQLLHIDTYRGLKAEDIENIGAFEYFGKKDVVCFIEWGKIIEKTLKNRKIKYYTINIIQSGTKRQINIKKYGKKFIF